MEKINEIPERAERMTKLYILKSELTAQHKTIGLESKARSLGLSRNQDRMLFSYYKLSNLSGTKKLEVLMESDHGIEKVELPERMLDNIARFLREDSKPRKEDFDCASFAHFVNDLPYEIGAYDPDAWKFERLESEKQLKAGDTVFITRSEDNWKTIDIAHAAIYLNKGLYISKFGVSGKLVVTTLEEMKKMFDGQYAVQAIPNPDKATASGRLPTPDIGK